MRSRTIKDNIKKTLFFSSSIILSTSFFAAYLIVKNECHSIESQLKEKSTEHDVCQNTIKSLNRKKNQLIDSIDDIALEKFDFIIPDPENIVITMDTEK